MFFVRYSGNFGWEGSGKLQNLGGYVKEFGTVWLYQVVLEGVFLLGLPQTPETGHVSLNQLTLHLVQATDQHNIFMNFHESSLQIPDLCTRDGFHIHVEDGLYVQMGDGIVQSRARHD